MEIQFQNIYYVYIMTRGGKEPLYVGITVSLKEPFLEADRGTSGYHPKFLVYYEEYEKAMDAISRESKLLGFSQRKLKRLVKTMNPEMKFLREESSNQNIDQARL